MGDGAAAAATGSAGRDEPRIAPGTRQDIGPLNSFITSVIGLGAGGQPPHVFTTLARHRRLFRGWLRFAARLMPRGTLPRADTELLILRTAHNCSCEYEWGHHERIGRAVGLTREQIAAVRAGPGSALFDARQRLLLEAADELHADGALSDELWGQLRPLLSDTDLIELCLLVGHYEMLAMAINSLRIQPEERGTRTPSGLLRALGRVRGRASAG